MGSERHGGARSYETAYVNELWKGRRDDVHLPLGEFKACVVGVNKVAANAIVNTNADAEWRRPQPPKRIDDHKYDFIKRRRCPFV